MKASAPNSKEDKNEESINLNVESKSVNDLTDTKSIEMHVWRCNNITDNGAIKKGRGKTYEDVVSDGSNSSTEDLALETQK